MLPQQSRLQHEYHEFIPQPKSGAEHLNPDAEIQLSLLCTECVKVRDWVRDNLRSIRELSPLEDQNCFNTESTFTHHQTGSQLHRSSEDGCHLCTIIWENLIEMDSYWVKSEDHWTLERERLTQKVEKGHDLKVRVFVPRAVHRTGAFGSYQLRYLAFATLRATIRIESGDELPHSSNPIMLCTVQFLQEVGGVFKSKSADKLKPFKFSRPQDAIDNTVEATYDIPQYDSDSSERLSRMDLQHQKFFENMGPREFRPTASLYTGSHETKETALRWLTKCLKTHHRCASLKATGLPTRLIDISYRDGLDVVCLIDSKDLSNDYDERYACLSYCWGRQEVYTLTLATIDKARDGISVKVLPKTIQDAVLVARHLGLKLMWIDALCIIQDSKEDWEREAARMCDVYEGCFICIAAKGASSAMDGLFSMRDPLRHTPCHLFRTEAGESIYVLSPYITTRSQHARPWALDRRGWVVQERILPPRTINFGSYLSWECREGLRDEFDIEEVAGFDRLVTGFFTLVVDAPPHISPVRAESIISFWMRILVVFTETTLTISSDRYAALYGIITAIKRCTGWSEVAGIWEPYIVESLLWSPKMGMLVDTGTKRTGLSPSWSWISLASEITIVRKEKEDEELAMIDVDDPTKLDTKFSGTAGPRLSIDCLLIPLRSIAVAASPRYKSRLVGWPSEDSVTAVYDIDNSAVPVPQQSFMPLLFGKSYIKGLIVHPSTKGSDTFQRLGFLNINFMTRRRQGTFWAADKHEAPTLSDSGSASWHNSDSETDEEEEETRRSARRKTLEHYERRLILLV